MMEAFDRRNYIIVRIETKKSALNALIDQAQASGLNDGLRFQIERTRGH
jgi:predicted outer membrane protein